MKLWITGLAGVLAGALLGGCASDPLSDLDGNPAAIVADVTQLTMAPGASDTVTASVVDGRFTPLGIPVTFTPCDADFTVAIDPNYNPVPRTSTRVIVTAGATADASCVEMSAGGVRDTIYGGVLPTEFNGALSNATPAVGDTLTLTASGTQQFADTANVDFGGGVHGWVVERSATTLRVIVPQPDSAQPRPVTVSGVAITYVPGLVVALPTTELTIDNPNEPNNAPQPAVTAPIPGEIFDGFVSSDCVEGVGDACDKFYTITLGGTTTFTTTLEWQGEADLDLLFCNAACSALVGSTAGATAANPETATVTLNAGTYNIYVNAWENNDDPVHLFKLTMTTP